jgi:hypothetical protein
MESPMSIVRLTGRDKELLAHVATTRYLDAPTTEKNRVRQVAQWEEGTGASAKDWPSDIACRRRLIRLCAASFAAAVLERGKSCRDPERLAKYHAARRRLLIHRS